MLLLLSEFLQEALGLRMPCAFLYFSTRMILAAATTLLFVIIVGPRFIKKLYELKMGQTIRGKEECPLLAELHGKKDTPTMGGILLLASIGVALFLWMDLRSIFTWLLLFTMVSLGVLGGIDDYLKLRFKNSKGLRARKKMLIQLILSGLLAVYLLTPVVQRWVPLKPPTAKEHVMPEAKLKTLSLQEYISELYIPFFKGPVMHLGWMFSFLLIVFIITGSSNAVNLTDGLDGLAAGCLVMVSMVLGLFAFFSNHIDLAKYLNILYIEGSGEIAVFLFAMAGACLGFLWYNGYPAQVFMGDTGSLALGGALGFAAVLLRREIVLGIAGIIFVAEAMSVILQVLSYRYRNKKRVFLCAPLHHHFEYLGWPETKVVIRFWIVSLLFAMIAVATLKLQ